MKTAQTLYRAAMRQFRMALMNAVHSPIGRIRDPDDDKIHLPFFEEATDAWVDLLGNDRFGIDDSKCIHCDFAEMLWTRQLRERQSTEKL